MFVSEYHEGSLGVWERECFRPIYFELTGLPVLIVHVSILGT